MLPLALSSEISWGSSNLIEALHIQGQLSTPTTYDNDDDNNMDVPLILDVSPAPSDGADLSSDDDSGAGLITPRGTKLAVALFTCAPAGQVVVTMLLFVAGLIVIIGYSFF